MNKKFTILFAIMSFGLALVSCNKGNSNKASTKGNKVSFEMKVYENKSPLVGGQLYFIDNKHCSTGLSAGNYTYDKANGILEVNLVTLFGSRTDRFSYDATEDKLTSLSDKISYKYSGQCTAEDVKNVKEILKSISSK